MEHSLPKKEKGRDLLTFPREKKNPYDIDLEEFSEKKKEFNDFVEGVIESAPRMEVWHLINRIVAHSPEDGIRFADKARITPAEWSVILGNEELVLKHPKLLAEIASDISHIEKNSNPEKFSNIVSQNFPDGYSLSYARVIDKDRFSPDRNLSKEEQDQIETLGGIKLASRRKSSPELDRIDDFYSYYLAKREFFTPKKESKTEREKVAPKEIPSGEAQAEKYLKELEPFFETRYLSGDVSEVLLTDLRKNNKDGYDKAVEKVWNSSQADYFREVYGDNFDAFSKAVLKDRLEEKNILSAYLEEVSSPLDLEKRFLSAEDIESLAPHFSLKVQNELKDTRYQKLDIIDGVERKGVESTLVKELRKEVQKEKDEHWDVVLDLTKDEYKIIDSKESERQLTEKDIEIMRPLFEAGSLEIEKLLQEGWVLDSEGKYFRKDGNLKSLTGVFSGATSADNNAYLEQREGLLPAISYLKAAKEYDAHPILIGKFLIKNRTEYIKERGVVAFRAEVENVKNRGYAFNEKELEKIEKAIEEFEASSVEKTGVVEKEIDINSTNRILVGDSWVHIVRGSDDMEQAVMDGVGLTSKHKRISIATDGGKPYLIDGKPIFLVDALGKKQVIYNGRLMGESHSSGPNPIVFDNKLVTVVEGKNKEEFQVMWDGKPLGRSYDTIDDLAIVNGKPAFISDTKLIVGGLEVIDEGHHIYSLTSIDNKPAYIKEENLNLTNQNSRYSVIWDEKQVSGGHKNIHNLTSIDNKPAYVVAEEGKSKLLWGNSQIYEAEAGLRFLTSIRNKPAFVTHNKNKDDIIIWNGQQVGGEYSLIFGPLQELPSGEITFIAKKDDEDIEVRISLPEADPKTEIEEKLELINLVHNPSKEGVEEYLKEHGKEEEKETGDDLKSSLTKSKAFLGNLARTIKNSPRDFVDTIAARKTSAEKIIAKQIVQRLLPGVESARKPDTPSFFGGGSLFGSGDSGESITKPAKKEAYFASRDSKGYTGGNPETDLNNNEVVMTSREPLSSYVISDMYGKESGGFWSKSYIPIDSTLRGPTRENTLTIPLSGHTGKIRLQKTLHSELTLGRIQGRKSTGEMIQVPYTVNSLGEGVADVPPGVEDLVYSFSEAIVEETPLAISDDKLDTFKARLVREGGEDYLEEVEGLDEEVEFFVESIKGKSPKEKLYAIEEYVRQIGYYDFKNGETADAKNGATSPELFYLMKSRLESIRDDRNIPEGKVYAGVCDDFSKLTTAILRKAGLPSGTMTCFSPDGGKEVTVGQAHAASFVVWPTQDGKNGLYLVDGTPSGTTPEEKEKLAQLGLGKQTLREKEEESIKQKKELVAGAEKDLEEIEKYLQDLTPEKIKEIDNGKLEKALNTILSYDVSYQNLSAISRILDVYRFSPLAQKDLSNLDDKIEVHTFLEREISSARESGAEEGVDRRAHPGTKLFSSVKEFARKESLSKLREIELLSSSVLSSPERRALSVIIKYLEAKRII